MEDHAFTLMPMSQEISLDPGTTYEGHITVTNPADASSDFSYKVSVDPYGVSGEKYDVDLLTQYNRSLITEWITIDHPTGTLKPNESKQINYTIKVPKNAPAGGQYAAITVAEDNATQGNDNVIVSSVLEMASVVYAKVAGETNHDGKVLENNIPSFVTSTPVTIGALISNEGNVHEAANFTISVTDLFTGQVILPGDDSAGRYSEIIMPETTYRSERVVGNLPAVGVVKINQTIRYNGEVSITERDVVICPIWFMALMALTLCAFIAVIVTIIRKHRKRKKSRPAL